MIDLEGRHIWERGSCIGRREALLAFICWLLACRGVKTLAPRETEGAQEFQLNDLDLIGSFT